MARSLLLNTLTKEYVAFFPLRLYILFRQKSMQIDAQAFWRLVKQCGIPSYAKGKKTESDLTDFYYHLFNFTKQGFRTRDSLTSGKKKFK